jgi:hypothetical protein
MVQGSLSKPLTIAAGVVAVAATFYGGTLIGQASNPSHAVVRSRLPAPVDATKTDAPAQVFAPTPAPEKVPDQASPWKTEVKAAKTEAAEPVSPRPAPPLALPKLPPASQTPKARLDPAIAATAAIERLAARRKDVSALASAWQTAKSSTTFKGDAWNDLAQGLVGFGELDAATAIAEHVIANAGRLEDTAQRARASDLLAEIAERQGERENLERYAIRAVELGRDSARSEIVAANLVRLAELQLKANDAVKAEALLMEARTAAFASNNPKLGLLLQKRVAVLARMRGDLDTSFSLLDTGLKASHALQLPLEMADFYAELGEHHAAKGEREDAISHWRAARDQYESLGLKAKVKEMAQLMKSPEEIAAEQKSQLQQAPASRKPARPPLRKSS